MGLQEPSTLLQGTGWGHSKLVLKSIDLRGRKWELWWHHGRRWLSWLLHIGEGSQATPCCCWTGLTPLPGTACAQSLNFGWKTGNSGLLCYLTTKKAKGALLYQGCDQCHVTLACGSTWSSQHSRDTHKSWEKPGKFSLEVVKHRGLIFPVVHRRWGTGKLESVI